MAEERFIWFLRKQHELYKPALLENYLPDLQLVRYEFPEGVRCPDNIRRFDEDNSRVQEFIRENKGNIQNDVSLRAMEYIYGRDEEKYLPLLVTSKLADYLHAQPGIKAFSQAQDVCNDDPSRTLTAVETAKGVLLFEYSGYGKECCKAYTQHLANRFFTPEGQSLEYVNLYKMDHPGKDVLQSFQNAPNAFSLYSGFFLPDKAQYLDASILRLTRMDRSHRIEPTFDAFRQFTSSYGLTTDVVNTHILRLLSLRETGGIYGMERSTNYIPFVYKNSFDDLPDKLKKVPQEDRNEQNRIKKTIEEKADYILKRDYELFSNESRMKEAEPVISLQTSKGAVYLPVTDEGAKYKRFYLQYLADGFFTPSVRSLQRVREFYISNPNRSTTEYMRKHLEFFRSSPTFMQLEKMPLYPILQSEALTKGGYPLEATYHAFGNFTQDYHLDISSVNKHVSDLLFIREYGLPADFRTNTEYDRFPYKNDFREVDREMARLQSRKGYGNKDFYTVQNKQQHLADKLLKERYGVTCPPLQLTGPAPGQKAARNASEKRTARKPRL
nr:DUF6047 family protein [uncultured Bacteroides sp.]